MNETNCLTTAVLEVGMRHEARMSFTRGQVEQYCALSGDHNAIHRDPEAAGLRFPGIKDIVVPGGLIQISVTGVFGSRFPGDGTLGLTFTPDRMRRPVCPGDEIIVTLEITRIKGPILEVDIKLSDDEGKRVGSAQAKLIAPDDRYLRWWEGQQRA